MKIGIAGPISTESISYLLEEEPGNLPHGYAGAPLFGNLIGALLERGHSIVAYTTSSDVPPSAHVSASGDRFKITYCSARPHAFRFSQGRWGRAADVFKCERACLSQAMQDDALDLVHAHWSYEFALAAIESGVPHLVTCHDAPQVVLRHTPNAYRLMRYFMARQVLKNAQHLTAVSPYLQQKVEGYARVPVNIVPNPLPAHTDYLVASSKDYDPARPRVAMVLNGWGALKNPQSGLRAFAILRQTFPAAELSVMGIDYGPEGKAASWAKAQGLTQGVNFMGMQPYHVLLAKLAEFDLLLHPSLEETFGMSIAEAMSLGIPVVGGQTSGAVPWVIGAAGRLVDVRSPGAIAQAAIELLQDEEALAQLGAQAKSNTLERFSPGAVAAAYEVHYLRVAAEAHGA